MDLYMHRYIDRQIYKSKNKERREIDIETDRQIDKWMENIERERQIDRKKR